MTVRIQIKNDGNSINTEVSSRSFSSLYAKPTGYHNLPIDILTKIFKNLDECELRNNIGLVNRRWRHACLQPELWKKFEIYGKNVPISFILRKIRHFRYLQTITLNTIAKPTAVIKQICRYTQDLKHLAITNCTHVPESSLRSLVQSCTKLESLDFNGTRFCAKHFYEEIAGLKNLRSLNFSKNSFLSVSNLISVVLNCHKLEELKLSQFRPAKDKKQLTDEDASFIILSLAPSLKCLSLDTSTLSNFSFKAIMQCRKLEKLGLCRATNLSPDIFIKISNCLPKLKELKITHAHQIDGSNVSGLFQNGKQIMGQIVIIDFTGCWKITDDGIDAIANCCTDLQSLTLKGCKRIKSLHSIRDNCKKLELLNIAFCTNLDLRTMLPISEKFHTLVVDKSEKFTQIINNARIAQITIRLSVSEYNKDVENYVY